MNLEDCEVGCEVIFRYGQYLIHGIVCLKNAIYSSSETRPLIGYTTLPTHPHSLKDTSTSAIAQALRDYGCVAGWMFLPETKIDSCVNTTMRISRNVKKSSGMYCSGPCKDFNQWAEPNQPDGTYKCYGCRKH